MSDKPDNPDDAPPPDDQSSVDLYDWKTLYQECVPGLRAFLRRRLGQDSDVDDCLQVVYLKMLQTGTPVAPSSRRAWLFRVAANESAAMWRKRASTDRMLQRQGTDEAESVGPSQELIFNETKQTLHLALDKLPKNYQEVIRLRIIDDLTFQQIANKLGIPLGTALTRMRRGLDRLRNELHDKDV